jgi:methionyl-tRNA synthetase
MSKSLGNAVNPVDIIDQYGVVSVRSSVMSEMTLGQDANFTPESFIKRYNSDLANDFGNLLNRISGLIARNFEGCIPTAGASALDEKEIQKEAEKLVPKVHDLINQLQVHEALEEIIIFVRRLNTYLASHAPWKLAKTDPAKAASILYTAGEGLRMSALLLLPVMPSRCQRVLEILGAVGSQAQWGELKPGTKLQPHEPLFPRIEE